MPAVSEQQSEIASNFVQIEEDLRVYTVRSAPRTRTPRGTLLICPPLLEEHHWSYRTLYRLSCSLSARGWVVWRFDPAGTGNSEGRLHSIAAWENQARALMEHVLEFDTTRDVAVIGLRLGASIAHRAFACDPRVGALVMLEPVLDRRRHLRQLLHLTNIQNSAKSKATTSGQMDRVVDYIGYQLDADFVGSFQDNIDDQHAHDQLQLLVLDLAVAGRARDERINKWVVAQRERCRDVERRAVHGRAFWSRLGEFEQRAMNKATGDWLDEVFSWKKRSCSEVG